MPLVAALALAAVAFLPGGVASSGLDCADAVAQAGGTSVGLVVDFGTLPGSPGGTSRRCVPVSAGANGFQVLQAGGHAIRVDSSGLLCAIDGYPAGNECGDRTSTGYRYWAYFHGTDAGWSYSGIGPGGYRVGPGSVEGWHFVEGRGNASDPPPSGSSSASSLCGSPPPSTSPPPPAPPPTAAAPPPTTATVSTGGASGGPPGNGSGGSGGGSAPVGSPGPGGVSPADPGSAPGGLATGGPVPTPEGPATTTDGAATGSDGAAIPTTSEPDAAGPSGGGDAASVDQAGDDLRRSTPGTAEPAVDERASADSGGPPATDLVAASGLSPGASPPWSALALVVLVGGAAVWRFRSRRPA